MKHTPGPWTNEDYAITADNDGSVICSVKSLDDFPCIEQDNSEEELKQLEAEFKANANLIARAPELLEELETLCQAIEGHRTGGLTNDGLWHYVQKARLLIAKAEGSPEERE